MVMSDICIESVPTYESLFLGFLTLYKVLTELCLFTRIFVNDDQGHNALNRAGPVRAVKTGMWCHHGIVP